MSLLERQELSAPSVIDLREVSPGAWDQAHFDVAVVGLGYVGLPTALAFHAAGCTVVGVDASPNRLTTIQEHRADLLESDRNRLSHALSHAETFRMTGEPTALTTADAVVICVPTPIDDYLLPDLTALTLACRAVVEQARAGQVLILTSTTYVGCTRDLLVRPLQARGFEVGTDIHVAFSPERIDPGNDQHALEAVPRVVGGVTPQCGVRAGESLRRYATHIHPVSSPEAAEMVKLVENTFRAVNIALANEFADVCRALGLSVLEIIDAAATKPYGFMPFYPGPGVGGHCIPCDPHYLLWQLRRDRVRTPIIEDAMAAIASRPLQVIERIRHVLSDNGLGLRDTSILVCGMTYKPNVADVRESPALTILNGLHAQGARISFHDPLVGSVRMNDGTVLSGVSDPSLESPQLLVLLCVHGGMDLSWIEQMPLVLDATFRQVSGQRRTTL